jgi:hypothetical protein
MTDDTAMPAPRHCCDEGGCRRALPFLFMKTPDPDNRWLLITRYKLNAGETEEQREVEVLERHDVTIQIERILIQYREFLDAALEEAIKLASAQQLEQLQSERGKPRLILPGDER